jgi:hypothetical protein
MTPDEIRRLFEKHWIGTDEELDAALERFFDDIQNSWELAMSGSTEWASANQTVADYVSNHYFS